MLYEVITEGGRFLRAVTRGDGRVGDDITANAAKMSGVIGALSGDSGPDGAAPFSGGVRGEVIMTRETLKTRFPDKANCRNAANGLMKRKDGQGCEFLRRITSYNVCDTKLLRNSRDPSGGTLLRRTVP